jgi:hypothetical protein
LKQGDKKIMNQERIGALLDKYYAGQADDEDLMMIENLIEKGKVDPETLKDYAMLEQQMEKLETPPPSLELDDRFYQMLALEKKAQRGFNLREWFSSNTLFTQLAMASVIFIAGIGIGFLVFRGTDSPNTTEMTALSDEVRSLKEMMMLSLLEKESATDRLKAVSLSQEMEESSAAVTAALIKTLNSDENVNVRLAALEALKPYGDDGNVRKELIRSISKQDSPLVQIALAELMASLQEKSSVTEFDKLLQDDKTPREVKRRIKKSIEVLI